MTRTNNSGAEARGNADPLPAWQEPRLSYVGHVGDVLQSGGGKLSPQGGDPGENRVEKPHAP